MTTSRATWDLSIPPRLCIRQVCGQCVYDYNYSKLRLRAAQSNNNDDSLPDLPNNNRRNNPLPSAPSALYDSTATKDRSVYQPIAASAPAMLPDNDTVSLQAVPVSPSMTTTSRASVPLIPASYVSLLSLPLLKFLLRFQRPPSCVSPLHRPKL